MGLRSLSVQIFSLSPVSVAAAAAALAAAATLSSNATIFIWFVVTLCSVRCVPILKTCELSSTL